MNGCLLSWVRWSGSGGPGRGRVEMGVAAMAGTAVVATGYGERGLVDVPAVADSLRALVAAEWDVAVVAPPGDTARSLALALGLTRAGRRAVPVVMHVLVDPTDPAFAHPPALCSPDPLAVLEAEGIAALLRSGFPVVATGVHPVVPSGGDYRPVAAALDEAASAQRLAGDLGASALVFVSDDEAPLLAVDRPAGAIDAVEAERRLAGDPALASALRASARFVRAGGELAAITTPAALSTALDDPADGPGLLHIRRQLAHPRSGAPALAAGWL